MYVCIYSFLLVRSRARLRLTLTARRTAHFMWAGVALTNATECSIAHTPYKKRKQIKIRQEWEREARQNELEILKIAMLEVRIIKNFTKQAIILILSSSLAYSMLCIS